MIASATLLLVLASVQEKVDFLHSASNLKFSHPSSWKVKRVKDDFQITISLPNSKEEARLDVYAVSFMAAPEVWENSQRYFAEQLKQTIKARNREEILGVPLLLYKLQETETPARKITLSGLIYAATEYKLQFRLTASEAAFGEAEFEFRQILQSFATIDGKLPQPEREGRATEAPASSRKPFRVPDKTTTALGGSAPVAPAKVTIGEVRQAATVAGKAVELCLPIGATATVGTDGVINVAMDGLAGPCEMSLFSNVESPKLSVALIRRSASLLDEFTVVKKRDESRPNVNAAGAKITRIVRWGTGKSGELTQVIAGGEKGDLYWVLVFRTTASLDAGQMKVLDTLIQGTSLEPKS